MSNIERPTTTATTTEGHKVVYKTYITQEERRAITDIYLSADDKDKPKDAPRSSFAADDKAFELAIVSLDDSTENIVARCLSLPASEYAEIEEFLKPILTTKKK